MCDSVVRIIFGQMRAVFFLLLHFMHKCVLFGLSLTISAFSVIKFDMHILFFPSAITERQHRNLYCLNLKCPRYLSPHKLVAQVHLSEVYQEW